MSTAYALSKPASGAVQVPPHERIVLPNGMTLIVVPSRDVPLVAFQAIVRGGPVCDPRGDTPPECIAGVASIVAGLLEKGAGERDAFAFADAVEGAGGNFSVTPGSEALSINGQYLARDLEIDKRLPGDRLREAFRVDVGGIDEVDAGIGGRRDDVLRLGPVGAVAERHRAQTDCGNFQIGNAKRAVVHRCSCLN